MRNLEEFQEEIDILWLWHRQLSKSDIGDTEERKVILERKIERLQAEFKKLFGVDYVHFRERRSN